MAGRSVCSIDIFPTLWSTRRGEIPDDRAIDGLDLRPHLQSAGKTALDRDELLWHFPHYRHAPGPYSIIRKGSWKLIRWDEGISELYNLEDDLGETKNLAESQPQKLKALNTRLDELLAETDAKLTRPNPGYKGK